MKLSSFFLTGLLAAGFPNPVGAQQTDYRNVVKLNVAALPIRTLSMQYERGISTHSSVALSFNATPSGFLPLRNFFSNFVDPTDSISNIILSNSRVTHFSVTPEIRRYFGKQPRNGFYVGGYLRYASSTLEVDYLYRSDSKEYPINAHIRGASLGIGALIGVQFDLSPRVVMDWWIGGASVNRTTIKFTGTVDLTDVDPDDKQEVEEVLESEDFYDGAFDITIRDNGGTAKGTLTFPGFRTGLCIGYRF